MAPEQPDPPSITHKGKRVPVATTRRSGARRDGKSPRRRKPAATKTPGTRPMPSKGRFISWNAGDLAVEAVEFGKAMDRYKIDHRRPFPTWSEVLDVLQSLGYRKVAEPN